VIGKAGILSLLLCALFAIATGQPDVSRQAQAILSESCYGCHGPQVQSAGLRLDSRSAALAKAIVAGDAAHSPIMARLQGGSGVVRMPMGSAPLTAAKISVIRQWIDAGAPWPEGDAAKKQHWAFVAPVRPAVPKSARSGWARNPIDALILARLEHEGLTPSPEADRATLLRRVSLDLTGLPPTLEELDAFLADSSAAAYEKQVDRLLASPHYGERWARMWLDAARYADSNGYEKDAPRIVWSYRDWVINAFNRDLPYDRFVIEQIAGDLLPGATQDQRVATGFLRNSMINEEGGVDPEQFRMEAMFDRVDAIGKGILGITVQCAQCHDHKYDPIKHEEYYKLFAFLNDTYEANIAVYTPEQERQRAEIHRKSGELEAELRRRTPDWQPTHGGVGSGRRGRAAGVAGAAAQGRRHFDGRGTRAADEGRLHARARVRAYQAHGTIHRAVQAPGDSRRAAGTDVGSEFAQRRARPLDSRLGCADGIPRGSRGCGCAGEV
jgi:hypothetical protein